MGAIGNTKGTRKIRNDCSYSRNANSRPTGEGARMQHCYFKTQSYVGGQDHVTAWIFYRSMAHLLLSCILEINNNNYTFTDEVS